MLWSEKPKGKQSKYYQKDSRKESEKKKYIMWRTSLVYTESILSTVKQAAASKI